jgi:hypothetical protein
MIAKAFTSEKALEDACISTLEKNWREKCTIPTHGLYPFQWLWDSAFVAVGWSHIDMIKARMEFQTLFDCQWENGFMAHIIYHDDDAGKSYFPGSAFQGAGDNIFAPKQVLTSGISQPPNLGFCLEKVFNRETNPNDQADFYKNAITSIFRFHEYLYRDRDPNKEGLVYIRHNWESGTDNAVQWDEIWASFEPRNYDVERRDTQHVNENQRPTKKDYNYYLTLIELSKEVNFDEKKMYEILPFLVQDPLFNALLVASNESLFRMASHFGLHKIAQKSKQWASKTKRAMNKKLLDETTGLYDYYDLKNQKIIKASGGPSMCALVGGIPTRKIAKLLSNTIKSDRFCGSQKEYFLCPTNSPLATDYDSKRYWRGPVWIPINWLMIEGCRRYGFKILEKQIINDSIALVNRYGLFEYFDPSKKAINDPESHGYGGGDFSWTAALILDVMRRER